MFVKIIVKYKIVLVGDSGVGKFKILLFYLGECFNFFYV